MLTFRERVLCVARVFAEARGFSLSTVSTLAANDGKVLRRLEEGRDIHTDTAVAMLRWFSANWPNDLPWPAGVDRFDVSAA